MARKRKPWAGAKVGDRVAVSLQTKALDLLDGVGVVKATRSGALVLVLDEPIDFEVDDDVLHITGLMPWTIAAHANMIATYYRKE